MSHRILRLKKVIAESGLSRSTIYARIAMGLWPKPIPLGGRIVGWLASEVEALNAARAAGMPDRDISELVTRLISKRRSRKPQEVGHADA